MCTDHKITTGSLNRKCKAHLPIFDIDDRYVKGKKVKKKRSATDKASLLCKQYVDVYGPYAW